MKTTVNFNDFCDAFSTLGRGEQFSYDGKKVLFDYLCETEKDTGEEIELDVIALCCEYTEYKNIKEFQQDYDNDKYKTLDDIEKETTVIKINDESFIIAVF